MAKAAMKRLQTDLQRIQADPPPGVNADLSGDNIFEWDAIVFGPGGTPFDGGMFRLKLQFPMDYPTRPPTVWFYSRMFHPNVYANGKICLDILQDMSKWNPVYDASVILVAIQAMLGEPNPLSPANPEANQLFKNDKAEYERRVLQIVFYSETDGDAATGRNFNDATELAARVNEMGL